MFEEFQEVLKQVLPASLGFQRIEIRMPEVVLITDSGDFSLDAMSGGISAIFSISWQIYMFSQGKDFFTITIDEPENHLHPTMQRTLLPSLVKAFPKARIVCATHSPFVVSSFPEANIYALSKNESGHIDSHLLDANDIAGTPNDVLREIMAVESNLPIWVEKKIASIIESKNLGTDSERASAIMQELEILGIANSLAEYRSKRA
jgi:hypothetical protein